MLVCLHSGIGGFGFRFPPPVVPPAHLQQHNHATAQHVGHAIGHEAVAEPEEIRHHPQQETGSRLVAQQVKRAEGEHHRRPVKAVKFQRILREVIHDPGSFKDQFPRIKEDTRAKSQASASGLILGPWFLILSPGSGHPRDLVEQLVFLRAFPQAVERAQGLLVHLVQRPGDIVDAVEHVVNLLLLGQQVIQLCLQVRAVGG